MRHDIYSFFNVKEGNFPFKYLNTMISPRSIPILTFDGKSQSLNGKIGSWNGYKLSQAGRITFINSVLNVTPSHVLNVSWMPKKVFHRKEQCIKDFLWQKFDNTKGLHLISWDTATLPKQDGGLGIHDLATTSLALQIKRVSMVGVQSLGQSCHC